MGAPELNWMHKGEENDTESLFGASTNALGLGNPYITSLDDKDDYQLIPHVGVPRHILWKDMTSFTREGEASDPSQTKGADPSRVDPLSQSQDPRSTPSTIILAACLVAREFYARRLANDEHTVMLQRFNFHHIDMVMG
ncbi:unnamed protein product [Lupinus luteus]|uniref:Uncharacterized protein n=1 Tax=Lupinus luteus TaxID=3873 RepID=A0AAV1XMB5_LUPLU